MKESTEKTVRVGLVRSPKRIFDEIEEVTAAMAREGWTLKDTVLEETLGNVHLLFERDVVIDT